MTSHSVTSQVETALNILYKFKPEWEIYFKHGGSANLSNESSELKPKVNNHSSWTSWLQLSNINIYYYKQLS
jgi:hypothetical protein